MSVKCIDVRKNHHRAKWLMPWGPNHCKKLKDFDEAVSRQIEANDIVFAVHIPLPSKEMSPWFQFMLFIMQLDIAFKMDNDLSKCLARGAWLSLPRGPPLEGFLPRAVSCVGATQ